MKKMMFLLVCVLFYLSGFTNDTIVIKDLDHLKESIKSNSTIIIDCDGECKYLYMESLENIELIVRSKKFSINLLSVRDVNNAFFKGLRVKQFEDAIKNRNIVFRDSELIMYRKDWEIRGHFSFFNCTIKNIAYDTFYRSNCSGLKIENCDLYLQGDNFNEYYYSGLTNCNIYNSSGELIQTDYNGYYPSTPLKIKSEVYLYENNDNFCSSLVEYSASSNLKDQNGISYAVSNLTSYFDVIDTAYAWVEGVEGNGIGEKINFNFVRVWDDWTFWGDFCIVNGYTKDTLTWKNNSRVKSFNVYRNGILIAFVHLEDTMVSQTINLHKAIGKNEPAIGDVFTFEIAEVYEGDIYEDTAISYFIAACSP